MDMTIVGASQTFAQGIADWAVAAGHNVTIVGPSRAQAEAFVADLGAGRAAGPESGLGTKLVFAALPSVCLLDMWNFYGAQLDGRVLVVLGADSRLVKELSQQRPGVKVLALRTAGENSEILLEGDDAQAKHLVMRLFQEGHTPALV
jgi:predicted dinucleotide-binding enzyme